MKHGRRVADWTEGASHHITNDASTMSDMRPLDEAIHITFATVSGRRLAASGLSSWAG